MLCVETMTHRGAVEGPGARPPFSAHRICMFPSQIFSKVSVRLTGKRATRFKCSRFVAVVTAGAFQEFRDHFLKILGMCFRTQIEENMHMSKAVKLPLDIALRSELWKCYEQKNGSFESVVSEGGLSRRQLLNFMHSRGVPSFSAVVRLCAALNLQLVKVEGELITPASSPGESLPAISDHHGDHHPTVREPVP